MPYISQDQRDTLIKLEDRGSDNLELVALIERITCAGDLQYIIAEMITEYLGNNYRYQNLNDVMGALAGAQMEFYRKVVAPYEDKKIEENGGVYGE